MKVFAQLKTIHCFIDVFTHNHKTERVFTYRTKNSGTRIVRIYIQKNLLPILRNFCHFNTVGTDHTLASAIELYLPNKIRWAQGFCLPKTSQFLQIIMLKQALKT